MLPVITDCHHQSSYTRCTINLAEFSDDAHCSTISVILLSFFVPMQGEITEDDPPADVDIAS